MKTAPKSLLLFFLLVSVASHAHAGALDLTSSGASGTINGAQFFQFTAGPAGTGVINSIVRFESGSGNDPITQGYNSDYRPVQYSEKTDGNFNRSVQLDAIPIVTIGGVQYREFLLDINEPGGTKSLLSIDEIEVYVADAGNLTDHAIEGGFGGTLGDNEELVYNLDAGADNHIMLDWGVNTGGSGVFDMTMYVPDSVFTNTFGANPFVYIYTKVGEQGGGTQNAPESNQDGYEEWAFAEGGVPTGSTGAVPEPGSLLIWSLLGVGMIVGWHRRRKNASRE